MPIEPLSLDSLPTYDVLDEGPAHAVLSSAQRLLNKVCSCGSPEGSWSFRESVWPGLDATHNRDPASELKPHLVLLPLSRIGAGGGFSGSEILLGYFSDEGGDAIYPSLPLVIKFTQRGTKEGKLEDERKRAESIRPYIAYHKDYFAVPLYLDQEDPIYDVLWSPFALTELVHWSPAASRLSLSVKGKDFRQLLLTSSELPAETEELVGNVYRVLEPLHRRVQTSQLSRRSFRQEYTRYLRGFGDKWGNRWAEIWGDGQRTTDFDQDGWYNPIWVVQQLMEAPPSQLYCGAVHGDLHPGNVLFSDPRSPSIIDFGWADDDSHVAKDFVLLECNLRFVTLPTDLPYAETHALAQQLRLGSTATTLAHPVCRRTDSVIQEVRRCFTSLVGESADFDIEYTTPLFLVAFGLLRFLEQYRNQVSARLTVLELARHIGESVLPRLGEK